MILLPRLVDFDQLHQLYHVKDIHLLDCVLPKVVYLVQLWVLLLELHYPVHHLYQHLVQALHVLVGVAVFY